MSQQTWVLVPAPPNLTSCVTLPAKPAVGMSPPTLFGPRAAPLRQSLGGSQLVASPQRMPSDRAASVCLCSCQWVEAGGLSPSWCCCSAVLGVTWSPAHNRTSVRGSMVACETFGQEASANGWQPLHVAWLYLMQCPRAPQPSDKLPSPHWRAGPEPQ